MSKVTRSWKINGLTRQCSFVSNARLLDVLREEAGATSVKEGCGEGECGACTVLLDGEAQLACMIAAAQVEDGAEILTAEGLAATKLGRSLQQSFDRCGAVQCGFCTPGMLLASFALLRSSPHPTVEQIKEGLAGNICRCTGYTKIIDAVYEAASEAGDE